MFFSRVFGRLFSKKPFLCTFFQKVLLGSRGRRLQVVAVQVTLQVEVRKHIALSHAQQTLQLAVRLDGVLLLQVLLLHVGGDGLRDIGAALLGAIAYTQERAQVVRQSRGNLEDRRLPGLRLLTLHGLLGLAAALVSLLL